MAGLRANLAKSNIYMAGVDDRGKADLLRITGFCEGTFPFRYLGVPMAAERLRVSNYEPLLDAVRRKIGGWPKHTLSYAGRLELVRSVLQGIECYWLSILPVPSGVVDKIYGICRSFVWSSKHPIISWDTLCLPKEEGGYGLRDLHAWNSALLCRALWNLQRQADSLWVRWIYRHYFKTLDLWHWQVRPSDSPLMKKLGQIRDAILQRAADIQAAKQLLGNWFSEDSTSSASMWSHSLDQQEAVDVLHVGSPGSQRRHRGRTREAVVNNADGASCLGDEGRRCSGNDHIGGATQAINSEGGRRNRSDQVTDAAHASSAQFGTGGGRQQASIVDSWSRGLWCGLTEHHGAIDWQRVDRLRNNLAGANGASTALGRSGFGDAGDPPWTNSEALWCEPPAHHGEIDTGRSLPRNKRAGVGWAYEFFQPRGTMVPWATAVWRADIMPKHRFTYWLAAHGRLRTADRMPYDPMKECVLCHSGEESNAHIFFRCSFTRQLWDKVRHWLRIRLQIYTVPRLFRAFRHELRGKGRIRKARDLAISCMIFLVWQARNRARFEGRESSVERLFLKTQTHVYRFVVA
ncbi:uncharacterized protein LOC141845903 [Curcuma longa]|uniref:uncharacterized protein LOC141845903 n=1 Tax=Curcuma longa TaxID=136217 RepID=UPI003D9EA8B2